MCVDANEPRSLQTRYPLELSALTLTLLQAEPGFGTDAVLALAAEVNVRAANAQMATRYRGRMLILTLH
jgi:hypothetical protein